MNYHFCFWKLHSKINQSYTQVSFAIYSKSRLDSASRHPVTSDLICGQKPTTIHVALFQTLFFVLYTNYEAELLMTCQWNDLERKLLSQKSPWSMKSRVLFYDSSPEPFLLLLLMFILGTIDSRVNREIKNVFHTESSDVENHFLTRGFRFFPNDDWL